MHVTYRCLAAATAALLAGPMLAAGAADARSAGTSPTAAPSAVTVAHRAVDAPGQDPDTLNGHGLYKVSLSNTADGHILVKWKWKKSRSKRLKKWKIVTSTSRTTQTDVTTYTAKRKKRSIVVSPAPSVTPASGDYTFVKVYTVPKHGKKHGSATHWIQAPVTAHPTGSARVTIGTFNVRDADLDKSGPHTWANRKQNVINTIKSSGAGIVNLQEASGMKKDAQGYSYLSQLQDIAQGTGMTPANPNYRSFFAGSGSQGTRILYNSNLYTVSSEGHAQLTGSRFIEWAKFTERSSGRTFWDVSMHLFSNTSAAGENTRVQEARQIIARVGALHASDGSPVYLAGDSNSTIYSKPKGLVHRTFIGAGFYDAFATTSITNQAYPTTNDFDFPVKPSPHRRDVILSYGAPKGSFWYRNLFYNSAAHVASDHFMQVAQLPL
ncbi:hypothetical protein P5P86_14415 [Nocardioides sp. BP30]|uniref:endonuclease/exonuclease/phosphatase family protein n=1 Tax=Nocardioides sp. BP30 TaxID=3036374 RepID=UPI0024693DAB|nr:endonuclease/exonuclease/phosphatase family protein [Nocardioides sp. BP30]WGL51152.1 hypothetical protein P5P86_14415 [Nocardioides sp. BP30]